MKKQIINILLLMFLFSAVGSVVLASEKTGHTSSVQHSSQPSEHNLSGKEAKTEEGTADEEVSNDKHHSGKDTVEYVTNGIDKKAGYPVLIILLPIIGAILILLLNKLETIRKIVAVLFTLMTFVLTALMWEPVIKGIKIGDVLYRGIYFKLDYFYNFSLSFKVDPAGYLIALVVSLVWLLTVIYGEGYLTKEGKGSRYDFFSLMTMAMNLGVMLAGDFLTLFIFFEGLVLFPYSMIAHREDEDSIRGANYYLYVGVATGLLLLAGIFLLNYFTGSIDIGMKGELLSKVPGIYKYLIGILMIAGFGGKAALFGEHIWVPKMYPNTLCLTAALSSGAMIKAGAYGIFRVANLLYSGAGSDWFTQTNIGYFMIMIGVVTMFLGVLNALISNNSQEMLGYSSVSQMGYIIMGIGCAAYMGKDGAMGLAGAVYHIVNHSLFKASLFLGVGAVYFRTDEKNIYKLGGLLKNMPFTAVCILIAILGMIGFPGFNGFASKTLLHHSIIEAYTKSAGYLGRPDKLLRFAEIMFVLTAAGTFATYVKLFVLTFLGKRDEKYKEVKEIPWLMRISLLVFSILIMMIGIFPNWLLENIIGPGLGYFGYDANSHAYHILYNIHGEGIRSTITLLYDPVSKALFSNSEVLHSILVSSTAIFIGGMYFILGFRFRLFHIKVPKFLTVEFYLLKIFNAFKYFCLKPCVIFGVFVKELVSGVMVYIWLPGSREGLFIMRPAPKIRGWEFFSDTDTKLNLMVDKATKDETGHHWDMFGKADSGYDGFLGKAIQQKDGGHWDMFGKVDSSYDGFLGKVIEKQGGLWRIFGITDVTYDTVLDRVIAGIIGLDAIPVSIIKEEVVERLPGEGIVNSYHIFCDTNSSFDLNIIDGIVNDVASLVRGIGRGLRRIHTGSIPTFVLSFIVGAIIIMFVFLFR